ncbi:MAG TPA: UDP-2,3-diacylglucosamine diphosphatase LpxI [Roseomonas sp.]|jgi:hypothetical protein
MIEAAAPLGILAGGGELPRRVAQAVASAGRPVRVVAIGGFATPEDFTPHPSVAIRFGRAARMLDWLRAEGVRQVVMAGTVTRPSMLSLMPDAATLKLVARIGRAAFSGDDSILQAVVRVLREDGFEVLGADALIAGLTPQAGLLAGAPPDAEAMADIGRGFAVAAALGVLDVGQAVVVQQGLVLGVEAIEGTDALLARVGPLRRDGPGGVLVKRVKPGQSRLVDLPTIGPRTVAGAATAGLRGLAIEANGTIVMERAATIAAVEAAGLFLLAIDPNDHDR